MFALPFFRRDLPALKGDRVTLRVPLTDDYREWSALRGESRGFLEPWEPRWTPDELDRTAWRQRISRYREDYAQGTAIAFFIFETSSGKLAGGITLGNIRHGVVAKRPYRLLDRRALWRPRPDDRRGRAGLRASPSIR